MRRRRRIGNREGFWGRCSRVAEAVAFQVGALGVAACLRWKFGTLGVAFESAIYLASFVRLVLSYQAATAFRLSVVFTIRH